MHAWCHADQCVQSMQGFNMEDVLQRAQECGAALNNEVRSLGNNLQACIFTMMPVSPAGQGALVRPLCMKSPLSMHTSLEIFLHKSPRVESMLCAAQACAPDRQWELVGFVMSLAGGADHSATGIHPGCGDTGHTGVGTHPGRCVVALRGVGPLPHAPNPHDSPSRCRRYGQPLSDCIRSRTHCTRTQTTWNP